MAGAQARAPLASRAQWCLVRRSGTLSLGGIQVSCLPETSPRMRLATDLNHEVSWSPRT